MPSTYDRRTVLRLAVSGTGFGLAGCLGSGTGESESTTGSQPVSPTETPTQTTTPTRSEAAESTQIATHTCDEQGVVPDVEVRNKLDEPVTVGLTVEDRTTDTVLFESAYDVPPNESTTDEDDYVFSSLDPESDHEIWATATVGQQSDTEDVSVVAHTSLIRGIVVAVTPDGVAVFDYHADPGPRVNWDCYPRD